MTRKISLAMNSQIESVWAELENDGQRGGSRRVHDEEGHNFYAAFSHDGQRGLQLLSSAEPPSAPEFDVVEIVSAARPDGKYLISIWLRDPSLKEIFGDLCETLVESAKSIEVAHLANFIFLRLLNWQRLLEARAGGGLGVNALRGLVGELIVLKRCLEFWQPAVVVPGWVGPLNAPHDFVLPSIVIEVKTILRSAPTVHITSIEQLDVPAEATLHLAVVSLVPFASPGPPSFSPTTLCKELCAELSAHPQELAVFEQRLQSAGLVRRDEYEATYFRLQSIRFYIVGNGFPRLLRSQLPHGITKAAYDINIGACESFETEI